MSVKSDGSDEDETKNGEESKENQDWNQEETNYDGECGALRNKLKRSKFKKPWTIFHQWSNKQMKRPDLPKRILDLGPRVP